jgi:hypothetical protein
MMLRRQSIAVGDDVNACVDRTLGSVRSLDMSLNFASPFRRLSDCQLDVVY